MKAKTLNSSKVWSSPDGTRNIYQVTLEAEGKKYGIQTFSDEIAVVGFEGEVETYDRDGKKFVKQPKQEGGYKGGGGGNNAARLKADAAKQQEIRAEWAIGKAISSLQIFPLDESALTQVKDLAANLYSMVDDVIAASAKEQS